AKVATVFRTEFADKIKVRLVPLDLTAHSPTPSLKGQALLGYFTMSEEDRWRAMGDEDRNYHPDDKVERSIDFYLGSEGPYLSAFFKNPGEEERLKREAGTLGEKIWGLRQQMQQGDYTGDYHELRLLEERRHKIEGEVNQAQEGRSVRIDLSRIVNRVNPSARALGLFGASDTADWLSHNGIVVPTKYGSSSYERVSLLGNSQGGTFWLRQLVALSDALRPDISLSRDRLQYLTWNVYSAISLAFRRATRSYAQDALPVGGGTFSSMIGKENFQLETLLKDPLIAFEGGWATEDIIAVIGGATSLEKIRARLSGKSSFTLVGLPAINTYSSGSYYGKFVPICAAALVQIGLKVYLKVKNSYTSEYVVDTPEAPVVREGQRLFPPLFFVPYETPKLLRNYDSSLNQLHPFSDWLIEHAVTIHEKYPGIFEAVRRGVSTQNYSLNAQKVAELNETLDRLWELDERIRPPKKFRLTLKDFGRK
ncbi:MAG TPA: hypothetical protein VNZ44_07300, partial [Pyrinomonadaceae bacterium]|nr:hypothetical protein [Pyrinomonadaceae bacterium]